jgi:hypothetical protein
MQITFHSERVALGGLAAPLWLAALLLVACAMSDYLAARRPQSQAWR